MKMALNSQHSGQIKLFQDRAPGRVVSSHYLKLTWLNSALSEHSSSAYLC